LDRPVASRIYRKLVWLADNFERIRPEPLKAELVHYFKLRAGDYRAIYEVVHDSRVIIVLRIGHRSEVYRPP